MKKTNFAFMAFAAGKESTEGSAVKRYTGVAPVFVLAVNPDKAELEKLYIKVLRYRNIDVNRNFDAVCNDILKHLGLTLNDLKPIK